VIVVLVLLFAGKSLFKGSDTEKEPTDLLGKINKAAEDLETAADQNLEIDDVTNQFETPELNQEDL